MNNLSTKKLDFVDSYYKQHMILSNIPTNVYMDISKANHILFIDKKEDNSLPDFLRNISNIKEILPLYIQMIIVCQIIRMHGVLGIRQF